MKQRLQISIPTPCHENWAAMSPEDKGRFCASCKKKVHDFTKASDREIALIFKQNKDVCGRFLNSQLERPLVVPTERKPIWIAASAAILSFLALGTSHLKAQVTTPTEQGEDKKEEDSVKVTPFASLLIKGTILDDNNCAVERAIIKNSNTSIETSTSLTGEFTIPAEVGQKLIITHNRFQEHTVIVDYNGDMIICLKHKPEKVLYTLGGAVIGLKIEPDNSINNEPERATHSVWDLLN